MALYGLPEIPASMISRYFQDASTQLFRVKPHGVFPMGKAARVDERIPPAHPLGVTNLGGWRRFEGILKGFFTSHEISVVFNGF